MPAVCVRARWTVDRSTVMLYSWRLCENDVANSALLIGAMSPKETNSSSATKGDPQSFMPLRETEKTLFHDTLRMLGLEITPQHWQKDLSLKQAPGVSTDQESFISEVPKEQASQQTRIDSSKEWPALMPLGSGVLDGFPDDGLSCHSTFQWNSYLD